MLYITLVLLLNYMTLTKIFLSGIMHNIIIVLSIFQVVSQVTQVYNFMSIIGHCNVPLFCLTDGRSMYTMYWCASIHD